MPIWKIRNASVLSLLLLAGACGGSEDAAPLLDDTSPLMSPASDAMTQTAPEVFQRLDQPNVIDQTSASITVSAGP